MLAMVRWLGYTSEKFIRGSESQSVTQTPPKLRSFLLGTDSTSKLSTKPLMPSVARGR
jgi:hypothetical protein